MPTSDTAKLTRALAAGARAFLASLDTESTDREALTFDQIKSNGTLNFDPLNDEPPFAPDPNAKHDRPANKLSVVIYLGSIARYNAETGHGAGAKEIALFARKAGYENGRAVNGWNSRQDSVRGIENVTGQRYVNSNGHKWLREAAIELHITIIGDITPIEIPEH